MESKAKRKTFDLSIKIKIIEEFDRRNAAAGKVNQTKLAEFFEISLTTLRTILKSRDKIKVASESGVSSSCKRFKPSPYEAVNKCVQMWFQQKLAQKVPVDGNMLKMKALLFAKILGDEYKDFAASNGWLQNFKNRLGITSKFIKGESGSVDIQTVTEWKEGDLQDILRRYNEDNIFNADETALFWKCLPDRTYCFKGSKVEGRKAPKDRVTVLVAANMSGSEKLPLLVIGKSKTPRCFKGQKLPSKIKYANNKKGWMLSGLFTEWVEELDNRMRKAGRKICLIVDNCPSHPHIEELTNVELKFLPPNTTSVLQPCDQGIIHAMKRLYRQRVLLRLIHSCDNNELFNLNLLQAIKLLDDSWEAVTAKTIANCFKHAGFEPQEVSDVVDNNIVTDEVDYGNIFERLGRFFDIPPEVTQETYLHIDSQFPTTIELNDEDIITEVTHPDSEEIEEDEVAEPMVAPAVTVTTAEAFSSLDKIDMFLKDSEKGQEALKVLRQLVHEKTKSALVQPKLFSFFKSA